MNINPLQSYRSQYHLTLGQLMEALDRAPDNALVEFEDGLCPTNPHCYRGYYEDLALSASDVPMTAAELRGLLRHTLGSELSGYKGGKYKMTTFTPLWRSQFGETSDQAIIGVTVMTLLVSLETKYVA